MAFFETNPISNRQIASLGDALDTIKAFNALYAVQMCEKNPNLCGNADDTAAWKKLVYDAVINVGGEPMELDFFETIFGGKTEYIDAKKLHFRYNNDIDMNIVSAENTSAPTAGGLATFTLLKGLHSGGGKYSYPSKGYSVYIYEDRQWAEIVNVDKGTDYGHRVTLAPFKKGYKINIRKGKKMMVAPLRIVGGLTSGPVPASSAQSTGYSNHVRPFRLKKEWEFAIDLEKGYEEVLQWAIMFDENGNEMNSWELFMKTQARKDFKWAKNLIFYLGQTIDNPDLFGDGKLTIDYSGFDGYIPTMRYGGGQLLDYDPAVGFDLEADYEPVIFRNDALKRTNEFVVLHAKQFIAGLIRRANQKFKENAGGCTFETFKRMGGTAEDITKLGITSYKYLNATLHFKEVSAMSDTRGIGNFDFPHLANFIPGNGLRDSEGREVPPFQFFMPQGRMTGNMEEVDRDYRKIDGTEKLAGYLAETVMMAIHAPHQHLMANPTGII
jgi:hypothetical protein